MITAKDVDTAAKLARIRLNETERVRMIADLERVTAYVDELFAAEVDDAEPMTHAPGVQARLRDDVAQPVLGRAALAGNAHFDGAVLRVPRVI